MKKKVTQAFYAIVIIIQINLQKLDTVQYFSGDRKL